MAVTQSMIDGLNQMIADGVRQATIDGQTVTYNTADSLRAARDDLVRQMARETAVASGKLKPTQTRLFYPGRGYK